MSTQVLDSQLMEMRVLLMRTIADVWKSDDYKPTPQVIREQVEQAIYEHGEFEALLPISPTQLTENELVTDIFQILIHFGYLQQQRYLGSQSLVSLLEQLSCSQDENEKVSVKLFNVYMTQAVENEECFTSDAFRELQRCGMLRAFLENCEPHNINSFWRIWYNGELDFKNYGVQIIKPTAVWNYYGDAEWTKPNTEALYISLPLLSKWLQSHREKTEKLDVEFFEYADIATHVTQYYQQFPSYFGLAKNHQTAPNHSQPGNGFADLTPRKTLWHFQDTTLRLKLRRFTDKELDPSGNNYNLGLQLDTFLAFSSMLIKLLTVVWQNEDLKYHLDYGQRVIDEICHHGGEQGQALADKVMSVDNIFELTHYLENLKGQMAIARDRLNIQYEKDLNAILKQHFDYAVPWNFYVRFLFPKETVFDSLFYHCGKDAKQEHILNLNTIEIPFSPGERDKRDTALALTRYNAYGPAFPFTCS